MRLSRLTLFLFGSLISFSAVSADLLQIYSDALSNDAQYASARAALRAGQRKITQGRAGLLPSINFGGAYDQSRVRAVDLFERSRSVTYSLSLSQPLFNWANWEQYQGAKLQVAVSEAVFAQAQLDLITRVAQAYFDVLNAQDAVATSQAQMAAITEQLAFAKENLEAGTTVQTDTYEAQARFDQARAQALSTANDLAVKRTALQQIVGRPANDLAPLRQDVVLRAPAPGVVDPWVNSAEQYSYSVVGSRLALELAKQQIKLSRAGHAPTVDLVLNRAGGGQDFGSSRSGSIGVIWNLPLFSGFSVSSRVEEAIDLEEKARHDLDNVRRGAAQAARQYFLTLHNNLAQVDAFQAALASSKAALEFNQLSYQIGTRINTNVLDAQQAVYQNQGNLARARYDAILNGLRLKSAAGTLKEEDLVEVNNLLQR